MAKFKVGDRAKLVLAKTPKAKHREGSICTIVAVNIVSYPEGLNQDYGIVYDNHPDHPIIGYWTVMEWQLEPIIELGSWNELQKTINWNPTKEFNHVE